MYNEIFNKELYENDEILDLIPNDFEINRNNIKINDLLVENFATKDRGTIFIVDEFYRKYYYNNNNMDLKNKVIETSKDNEFKIVIESIKEIRNNITHNSRIFSSDLKFLFKRLKIVINRDSKLIDTIKRVLNAIIIIFKISLNYNIVENYPVTDIDTKIIINSIIKNLSFLKDKFNRINNIKNNLLRLNNILKKDILDREKLQLCKINDLIVNSFSLHKNFHNYIIKRDIKNLDYNPKQVQNYLSNLLKKEIKIPKYYKNFDLFDIIVKDDNVNLISNNIVKKGIIYQIRNFKDNEYLRNYIKGKRFIMKEAIHNKYHNKISFFLSWNGTNCSVYINNIKYKINTKMRIILI